MGFTLVPMLGWLAIDILGLEVIDMTLGGIGKWLLISGDIGFKFPTPIGSPPMGGGRIKGLLSSSEGWLLSLPKLETGVDIKIEPLLCMGWLCIITCCGNMLPCCICCCMFCCCCSCGIMLPWTICCWAVRAAADMMLAYRKFLKILLPNIETYFISSSERFSLFK